MTILLRYRDIKICEWETNRLFDLVPLSGNFL